MSKTIDAQWFWGLIVGLLSLATSSILAGEPGSSDEPSGALRPHERWIWTELIGFNNELADLGVGDYLDATGFTPTAICLLIGSPDFVLSHPGIEAEQRLPAEYCSRAGHEFNRERKRQDWTNHQLRSLIDELHARNVEVFLSTFATYSRDPTHREWISDHREVLHVHKNSGYAWALNCLSRLNDGSYFEDYFAHKMVETLKDYGFDGWHGADGWGPLSGAIHDTSFADDMIDQFATMPGLQLPEVVTQECIYDVPKLKARASWILENRRAEWSEFYAQRWTRFWQTMVTALHAANKKAVVNSAWGRAPFEAYYRYGIDYQRIAATGVDGIMVETVAAGLAMDPRLANTDRHDDFLAMLMLMRASLPETRLIFLHSVHDVVEQWDAIRHIPMVLEREIYALTNVFHTRSDGSLRPSADGLLACLGDGLKRNEWNWLEERWQLSFVPPPRRTHGATVVWSDEAYRGQMADFLQHRTWNTHHLIFHLMAAGATIQNTIDVNSIEQTQGALLVPNAHLFPAAELAQIMRYQAGPIVLVGRKTSSFPEADVEFRDPNLADEMWCGIYRARPSIAPLPPPAVAATAASKELSLFPDPQGYWDHLAYRPVSEDFVQACAAALQRVSTPIQVLEQGDRVAIMPVELDQGRLRIAIKNRTAAYAKPLLDVGQPIDSVTIRTGFPSVVVRPQGATFSVRVPGRGITVVDVVRKRE